MASTIKPLPLSPATVDLGMGANLQQQLVDNEEERKKKLLRQARDMQIGGGMGAAAQQLLGSYSV